MNENEVQPSEGLGFDKVDGSTGQLACEFCQSQIHDAYFDVNGQTTCQKCRYTVEDQRNNGSSAGRFFRALFAGSVAAGVGAGIYYAVLALTGYEFGLVAILVGFMVGVAVNWGSSGRGGWVYQALAVVLTYGAIVSTYVPFVFEAWEEEELAAEAQSLDSIADEGAEEGEAISLNTPAGALQAEDGPLTPGDFFVGLVAFVFLVAAIPFLAGVGNIIGLLIIGFGLYEAWRLNRYQALMIEGPFRVGQGQASNS